MGSWGEGGGEGGAETINTEEVFSAVDPSPCEPLCKFGRVALCELLCKFGRVALFLHCTKGATSMLNPCYSLEVILSFFFFLQ